MTVMLETEQPITEEEVAEPLVEDEVTEPAEANAEIEEVKTETEESGESKSAEETEEVESEAKEEEADKSEEEDEIIVSVEGEEEPEEEEKSAPKWVKDLRKTNREQAREIKKLKAQVQTQSENKDQTIELGKKPSREDFYTDEEYEEAYDGWHERKRKLDHQAEEKKQSQQKIEQAYQKKLETYYEKKAKTKVKNFEEIEQTVTESLNQDIQSAIVMESDDPHMVVAAIGSNPGLLEKFQNVKNGVALGKLIASTEFKMKVKSTRKPPPPEPSVSGNAGTSGSVKSTLEKLEAEADRTGDRGKLIQYLRTIKSNST